MMARSPALETSIPPFCCSGLAVRCEGMIPPRTECHSSKCKTKNKAKSCNAKHTALQLCTNLHVSEHCLNVNQLCFVHLREVSVCLCSWLQWQPQHAHRGLACFSIFWMESRFAEKLFLHGEKDFIACRCPYCTVCLPLELRKIHLIIFMQVCRSSPKRCSNSWRPSFSTGIWLKIWDYCSPEKKKICLKELKLLNLK